MERTFRSDFLEIQRGYLHILGNLTLITSDWNASLSNSSFEIKKQRLADHALALNVHYFSQPISVWNDKAMIDRTNALVDQALDIWQALGDPLVMPDVKGTDPKVLRIMEEFIEVNSWRDVIIQMMEQIIRLVEPREFVKLAQEYTSLLSREERKRSVQLSNSWWVYHSMNANTVMSYCERLATSVG